MSVVEFDDRITTDVAGRACPQYAGAAKRDRPARRRAAPPTSPAACSAASMKRSDARRDLHLSGETLSRVHPADRRARQYRRHQRGDIAAHGGRRAAQRRARVGHRARRSTTTKICCNLAEGGGGKYYYVESPVQLARIFEEELHSAFATSRARRASRVPRQRRGPRRRDDRLCGIAGRDVSADWPDFYAGRSARCCCVSMSPRTATARSISAISMSPGAMREAARPARSTCRSASR